MRIYELARELNVDSKVLIDVGKTVGLTIKNQLSSITPEEKDSLLAAMKSKPAAPPTPAPTMAPSRPAVLPRSIQNLGPARVVPKEPPRPAVSVSEPVAEAPPPAKPVEEPAAPPPAPEVEVVEPAVAPAPIVPPASAVPNLPRKPAELTRMRRLEPPRRPAPPPTTPAAPPPASTADATKPPADRKPRVGFTGTASTTPKRKLPLPGKPAEKKADTTGGAKVLAKLTPDMLQGGGGIKDVIKRIEEKIRKEQAGTTAGGGAAKPPFTLQTGVPVIDDDEEDPDKRRPGAVKGREERHKRRNLRAKTKTDGDLDFRRLEDEDDMPNVQRQLHRMRQHRPGTLPRKGTKVVVETPITVRSFSEAIGVRANDILKKLMERKQMVTINAPLEEAVAEELAIELGFDIELKRPYDAEVELLETAGKEDAEEELQPRAPIVTIMGHVDHGKTSLLDRIRESNVVATEAGGITQHLRAWRVEHGGRPITFLDTPGHEAFTQMRARGANVTDIVVLVVAADDGIMPQTDEAISHAKAAGVPIIVCINKVDLPNANVMKTRTQLYSRELLPDDQGGDTPIIETVANKDRARGINELLDMISLVAELKELKANPNRPATGVCLEARIDGDEGVQATLLVQNGTLRKGDVLVCGAAYGRVRAMFSDLGKPLEEAGPSVPVRVMGLDYPPNADDKFHVMDDLATAREIAEGRQAKARLAQPVRLSTFRLEDLGKQKAFELKVILKADVRGSIEAIAKELGKLDHEEVRVKVLHTGVGAITEGDVALALASPEDTMIVGFNVVPDDRAKSLAEEHGVNLRHYNIIYQLTDDLKAALEGRLKPREEIINLGRAVVRDTFKISRVGTIAGCYVTQGTIERSARVRLIRDGVVVYPPPEKSATLDSLKRFKDDAKEVREGFECGLKIAGFDDVKVGDVIEAYKVEQVQRTL